jgi:hypothetical protein
MSDLQPKDVCELVTIEPDDSFKTFAQSSPSGVALVPQSYGDHEKPVIKAAAGDFAKWMAAAHPEIKVSLPKDTERLVLHSQDLWLPLAFLASDISLPIYLNLVSSYLYERWKGALRKDNPRVHVSAEYEDKSAGVTKRFNFSGDAEALKLAMKKFDLNEFLNDDRPKR